MGLTPFSPLSFSSTCTVRYARNLNKEDAMDRGRWKKLIKIGWWSGWWVGECFFWYRLTQVDPDKLTKGRKTVVVVLHCQVYCVYCSFAFKNFCWLCRVIWLSSCKSVSLYVYLAVFSYCVAAAGGRYVMWSVLLRLLQDEEQQVRHVTAESVEMLTRLVDGRSPTGKYTLHVMDMMLMITGGHQEYIPLWCLKRTNTKTAISNSMSNRCHCTVAGNLSKCWLLFNILSPFIFTMKTWWEGCEKSDPFLRVCTCLKSGGAKLRGRQLADSVWLKCSRWTLRVCKWCTHGLHTCFRSLSLLL